MRHAAFVCELRALSHLAEEGPAHNISVGDSLERQHVHGRPRRHGQRDAFSRAHVNGCMGGLSDGEKGLGGGSVPE